MPVPVDQPEFGEAAKFSVGSDVREEVVRALLRVTQPVSESPDAVLFVVGDALGLALLIQVVVYVRKQFWNLSV